VIGFLVTAEPGPCDAASVSLVACLTLEPGAACAKSASQLGGETKELGVPVEPGTGCAVWSSVRESTGAGKNEIAGQPITFSSYLG
jgi:hypothetical protein